LTGYGSSAPCDASGRDLRESGSRCRADQALVLALKAVRALDIPHLDMEDEEDQVVH
jgi:hypothetical protein